MPPRVKPVSLVSVLVAENGPLPPSVIPLQVKPVSLVNALVAENGPLPRPVTPPLAKPLTPVTALVAEEGPLPPPVTPPLDKPLTPVSAPVAENGPLPPPVTPLQVKPFTTMSDPVALTSKQQNTSSRTTKLTETPDVKPGRGSRAPGEVLGMGSSTEKGCRLHSHHWVDNLSMAWEHRRRVDR